MRTLGYGPGAPANSPWLTELHQRLIHPASTMPIVELHWRAEWYSRTAATGGLARAALERSRPDPEGRGRELRRADELALLLLIHARRPRGPETSGRHRGLVGPLWIRGRPGRSPRARRRRPAARAATRRCDAGLHSARWSARRETDRPRTCLGPAGSPRRSPRRSVPRHTLGGPCQFARRRAAQLAAYPSAVSAPEAAVTGWPRRADLRLEGRTTEPGPAAFTPGAASAPPPRPLRPSRDRPTASSSGASRRLRIPGTGRERDCGLTTPGYWPRRPTIAGIVRARILMSPHSDQLAT